MKALIVTEQHTLELRDISPPEPGPYEALVKILACAICGTTDRELIKGTQPYNKQYPAVLGHESVGEVVEVGDKVTSFKKGDWVTRATAMPGGRMRDGVYSCWGGFAEYGIVSDRIAREADGEANAKYDYTALRQNVVPTTRGAPDLAQATLSISLGETASWIRGAGPLGGKRVCVAGTGIAGLSCALWAKLAGAKAVTVTGRRKVRLDLARDLAADHVVNVKEVDDVAGAIKELNGGGVDVFCEAVGQKDQLRIAMGCLGKNGVAAIYGVVPEGHYDMDSASFRSNVTVCTPMAEEHLAFDWALNMQQRGVIPTEKLMTHQWPFADAVKAFEQVDRGDVVKGMLVM